MFLENNVICVALFFYFPCFADCKKFTPKITLTIEHLNLFLLNPIALRMAKALWRFGLSECNRVKYSYCNHKTCHQPRSNEKCKNYHANILSEIGKDLVLFNSQFHFDCKHLKNMEYCGYYSFYGIPK